MKAFLRPHRFRHLYPVRFYTTKVISGHSQRFAQCPLYPGVFNRSTQHLLILPEEEVCDGGDCTNMVHPAAEG